MMIFSAGTTTVRTAIWRRTLSVWRSSPSVPASEGATNKQPRFNLDADFSHIKHETPLFMVDNPTRYRGYFALTVANFLFWTVCADLLYSFYSKLEREPAVLERQKQYEETKHQLGYFERFKQYFNVYGYKRVAKYTFWVIGTGTSALFIYLITRSVSSMRLMPGGQLIKVQLFNWHGSPNGCSFVWPLDQVSTQQHRTDPCHFITMRVRKDNYNSTRSYLIDRQGHFPNEHIYDLTVGVRRNLKR